MNNEIKLNSGMTVKLIDKEITGEQHMDVKKTYVATTKKEIVAKGIKYYQDKLSTTYTAPEPTPVVENNIPTPIINEPNPVIPTSLTEESVEPISIPSEPQTIEPQLPDVDTLVASIDSELNNPEVSPVEESPAVGEHTIPAPLYEEEPVIVEMSSDTAISQENTVPTIENSTLEGTPINFNIPVAEQLPNNVDEPTLVEPTPISIPEEKITAPSEEPEPFFNTMRIDLPHSEPVQPQEPLMNFDSLQNAEAFTFNEPAINTNVDMNSANPFVSSSVINDIPTVEPVPQAPEVASTENTIVLDASKESNLLNALADKNAELSNKTVSLDDTSLNSVRQFGEEPVKVNYQPNAMKSGFVNSKLLTVISILFFLASCGFLVYEIFNFISSKQ